MRALWGGLSSVWVGIFLLLNLAGLAVFILLRYPAPEAYFLHPLYLSILGAFGTNIACVLVSRFRWRLEQAGFLATHVGIVTALVGGAMTHWGGEDGQMQIAEGTASSRLLVERAKGMYRAKEIRLASGKERDTRAFDVAPPSALPSYEVPSLRLRVEALEYLEKAGRRRQALRSPEGVPLIRFRLGMAVASVEEWLEDGGEALEIGNGLRVRYRTGPGEAPKDKSITFGPEGFTECNGKGKTVSHALKEGQEAACTLSPLKVSLLERATGFVEEGFEPGGSEEAIRLRLSRDGDARTLWAPWSEPVSTRVGGEPVFLRFANPEKDLGFSVHLDDFRKVDYEGSTLPRAFESHVQVDGRPVVIRMNEPMVHRGWTFFQAAFAPPEVPGGRETTVLQVSHDPGKPVVYTGALLIVGGVLFMFYAKPWMKRMGWLPCLLLLVAAAPPARPTPNAPSEAPASDRPDARGSDPLDAYGSDEGTQAFLRAVDWKALDGVVVQHAGRRKPLEAFARETLWGVLGSQTYLGQPAAFTVLSMAFDPDWSRVRAIKVRHPEVAKALGTKKASLEDLGSEAFERLWAGVDRMNGAKSPTDRAVMDLDRRGTLLARVAEDLRVLPDPKRKDAPWIGMGEDRASSASPAAYNAFVEMERAFRKRDAAGFTKAARDWASACAAPSDWRIGLELSYFRTQPFRWACGLAFLSFLGFLGAWVKGSAGWRKAATALLLGSFLVHGAGIAARIAIAGRPPVSNMYEVVLWVSWVLVAISLLAPEVTRLPAALLQCLGLLSAALFPALDPHIGQVQAVLNSSYWLTVHVCTITSSYAILFLAFGVSVAYLLTLREPLDQAAWKLTQLGFLFLTVGVLTGAWWANASWGRYWGWDPKETGSFIAWCIYGAYLHLRRFGFLKAEGAARLSIAGVAAVLFTMIGVSYFLPGLHSYA